MIGFLATVCGPCVAELPNLTANYDKYHSKDSKCRISLDSTKTVAQVQAFRDGKKE